jgi:hypothetical protein
MTQKILKGYMNNKKFLLEKFEVKDEYKEKDRDFALKPPFPKEVAGVA